MTRFEPVDREQATGKARELFYELGARASSTSGAPSQLPWMRRPPLDLDQLDATRFRAPAMQPSQCCMLARAPSSMSSSGSIR